MKELRSARPTNSGVFWVRFGTKAWMHIKAMRVFVESVLRFGMPESQSHGFRLIHRWRCGDS